MRVYALSDLHVDHRENRAWIETLSSTDHRDDALIVAGDVSHRMDRLEAVLGELRRKFAELFFVPGNHEPWVGAEGRADSLEKFHAILDLCSRLGVRTAPRRLTSGSAAVWVVPLFSWYVRPEEGDDGLYVPKPGEDPEFAGWSDDRFIRWPEFPGGLTASEYFLRMNLPRIGRAFDAPVISFSHFLPRSELMFATHPGERTVDSRREFNFSRVAGARGIDRQLRAIGSRVHVYGHQHRNRRRRIDGVLYVSHCLGYAQERARDQIRGLDGAPLELWRSGRVTVEESSS